jgi:hypothetical protein
MNLKIEWKMIFMVLGAGFGGLLTVISYAISSSDFSLAFFPFFLLGGTCLGWIIERIYER